MPTLKSLTFTNFTAEEAWYMFTEAWLLLSGGLDNTNFQTGTEVLYDHQMDYREGYHTHDGTLGRRIHPDGITKKAFDLGSLPLLWGSYFSDGIDTTSQKHMIAGAYVEVACTNASGSFYKGTAVVSFDMTTSGTATDHGVLDSYATELGTGTGWIPRAITASVAESGGANEAMTPLVWYNTSTGAYNVHLASKSSKTYGVHIIGVFSHA